MTFKETLEHEMKKRGWDALRLASELTVSGRPVTASAVDKWLYRDSIPGYETLKAIAKLFDMPMEDLSTEPSGVDQ